MKQKLSIVFALFGLVMAIATVPTVLRAAEGDSAELTKLLNDAKSEAAELKADAADMEAFTKSTMSWESYAVKIDMVKGHVNNSGKTLTKLKDGRATGSPWQQIAIDRIEPVLRDMAGNTEATIKHLSDNKTKVHMQEFKDYVRYNYELASDLDSVIRDFVNYGETKGKFERLAKKLEIGG